MAGMDYEQHRSVMDGIHAKRQRLEKQRHMVLVSKEENLAKAKEEIENAAAEDLELIESDAERLNQEAKVVGIFSSAITDGATNKH